MFIQSCCMRRKNESSTMASASWFGTESRTRPARISLGHFFFCEIQTKQTTFSRLNEFTALFTALFLHFFCTFSPPLHTDRPFKAGQLETRIE